MTLIEDNQTFPEFRIDFEHKYSEVADYYIKASQEAEWIKVSREIYLDVIATHKAGCLTTIAREVGQIHEQIRRATP